MIIGPPQLPSVLKVDSDPIKFEILSTLGHPNVLVELTEAQLEQSIRVTGNWVATYFPREQKYAYFYTKPLEPTYNLPTDAYWVQSLAWNPSVTSIQDIFGQESFLFCYPGGSNILTAKGPMICEDLYKKNPRVITAFGPRKTKIRWNQKKQPITILKTERDFLICTPNHPISCDSKFKPAEMCNIGEKLINHKDKLCEITDKTSSYTDGTWSLQNSTGSMYVSALGKEFYLAH